MKYNGKTLSILSFIILLIVVISNFIIDFVILKDLIFNFIGACFVGALGLVIGCVLMVISIVFVFGIYIIESNGFWPINWAAALFGNVMGESALSSSQISSFVFSKITLISILIIVIIMSIISLKFNKKYNSNEDNVKKSKAPKVFSILSIILSIPWLIINTCALLIIAF